MEAPVFPQPPLDKASSFPAGFPLRRFKEARTQQEKDARGERLQASGQDAVRAAQPSPAQPACSRACCGAAAAAAERRPGGAGGSTPTCLGERARRQPLLLGWRRRDLRSAPPSPHSQPPRRLRRSLGKPCSPARLRGPREVSPPRGVQRSPGSGAWPGSVTDPGRAFPRLLETLLLQLAFCTVPSFTGRQALPGRILSGLCGSLTSTPTSTRT